MKTKFSFLLFVLTLILVFASCSKNDDNETTNSNNNEAKIFIGKWKGYYQREFRKDGTCTYSATTGDKEGIWRYENSSKTLITDIDEWNWKIISLSQDMWVGEHLAGKKGTFTYTRIKD